MSSTDVTRYKVAVLAGGWSDERAISLETGRAVETALHEAGCESVELLDVASDSFLSDFSNGGFEYEVFAPEGSVTVTIEEREGTWRGIHPAYAETPHRARVLCAYIDHGVAPKDASYRYRIVRKQTKENIK